MALVYIGGIVLLLGVLALGYGLMQKARTGRLDKTPFVAPSQIQANGRGLADPKGSISTEGYLRHGPLLISPVTRTQCLYYAMKVEAEWKVGDSTKRETVSEACESVGFAVADPHGQVLVAIEPSPQLSDSDISFTKRFDRKKFSRGLLGQMTQKPIEVTPVFSIPSQVHYASMGTQWEVRPTPTSSSPSTCSSPSRSSTSTASCG